MAPPRLSANATTPDPFRKILHSLQHEIFPRPSPGVRLAGSVLGVAATLFSRCPGQVDSPAGRLVVLDANRAFAYLAAFGGLVSITGSAFSLLAPPSGTAHAALLSLIELFTFLVGSTAVVAALQSAWRFAPKPVTAPVRLSRRPVNSLCLGSVALGAALITASGIVRTLSARHLDLSFLDLRLQLQRLSAEQVEATPTSVLQLLPGITQLRATADRMHVSVAVAQTANLVCAGLIASVAFSAVRRFRVRGPAVTAAIQLPLTPPGFDSKEDVTSSYFMADSGGEDLESYRQIKARDDLVLVCALVGSVAVVSAAASSAALVIALVPDLYWTRVTARRLLDLLPPVLATLTQAIALGVLVLETFRSQSAAAAADRAASSPGLSEEGPSGPLRSYEPLSTRVIKLSRRSSFRLARFGRKRRATNVSVSSSTGSTRELKGVLEGSDEDSSSLAGSVTPSEASSELANLPTLLNGGDTAPRQSLSRRRSADGP
ncbi:hypothetical protein BMF94_0967 [Rhodotorula taiwanensis]|uniref:Uncharacterized protein n=1 Tax=Rhodotorula taiwanensis TaxID=741276 RepID=A0A2S5BGJ0_9BASI|nr:hypothetical protein BMF94_0967 [Rhodotorula taiwanensis]